MAYLAGLSVTYVAFLDRLIELEKLAGRGEQVQLWSKRQSTARQGLAVLATDEGYFVKSDGPGRNTSRNLRRLQVRLFRSFPKPRRHLLSGGGSGPILEDLPETRLHSRTPPTRFDRRQSGPGGNPDHPWRSGKQNVPSHTIRLLPSGSARFSRLAATHESPGNHCERAAAPHRGRCRWRARGFRQTHDSRNCAPSPAGSCWPCSVGVSPIIGY